MKPLRTLNVNSKVTFLFLSIFVIVALLVPFKSLAAGCPTGQWPITAGGCCPAAQAIQNSGGIVTCGGGTKCQNVSGSQATQCLFTTYINPAVAALSAMVGIVVVIGIIRGALEYTSSEGDPGKAAAGKKHIMAALIGLLAYMCLFMLLQFIIPGGVLNG